MRRAKDNGALVPIGNGKYLQQSVIDGIIKNNPNLLIDFNSFDGKSVKATCLTNSHSCSYSLASLRKNKNPNRKGGGCKKCYGNVKKTNEEFDEELARITSQFYRNSDYTGANDPISIFCTKCNDSFTTTPHIFLRSVNCQIENPPKFTEAIFIKKLAEAKPHIRLNGNYYDQRTKTKFLCTIHNHEFTALPDNLLNGEGLGCKKCNAEKLHNDRVMSQETFVTKIANIHPRILVLGNYRGADKTICVRCLDCANEWAPYAGTLLQGNGGCSECSQYTKYTTRTFKKIARETNPLFEIIGKYVDSKTKIEVRCKRCDYHDDFLPYQILNGIRCKKCCVSGTSVNQEFLRLILEEILGKHLIRSRDTSLIGMELDILVPSLYIAFEPGDWYYHKDSLTKDNLKKDKCKAKGITLYTIYYNCGEDAAKYENTENTIYISNNLVSLNDKIAAFSSLLNRIGLDVNLSFEMYKELYNEAKTLLLGDSPEEKRRTFNNGSENYEMLGTIVHFDDVTTFRCKICNSTKQSTVTYIRRRKYCWNEDCPNGNKKKKYTSEEFLSTFVDPRDDIKRLDPFINLSTKFNVFCKHCNNPWFVNPKSLVDGRRHSCYMSKTTEEFIEEIKLKKPLIKIKGEYKGAQTKIPYLYGDDPHLHYATPDSMLHSDGPSTRVTDEIFKDRMKIHHPNLGIDGIYTSRRGKVDCHCLLCQTSIPNKSVEVLYQTDTKVLCPNCKCIL